MIRGVPGVTSDYEHYWIKLRDLAAEFAKIEGTNLSTIQTNGVELIQMDKLTKEARFKRRGDTVWDALYHGLFLLGTSAPLTVTTGLKTLLIASSHTKSTLKPYGSTPLTDELVQWGGLRVVHDGFERSRQEKIRDVILPYIRSSDSGLVPIKVCGSGYKRAGRSILNCGKCEKCSRTITGLVLAGIDPAACGFDMDLFGFPKLKRRLLEGTPNWSDQHPIHWTDLQRYAKDGLGGDLYDSKEFFEWFSGYDFKRSLSSRIISLSIPENSKRRRMVRRIRRSYSRDI